MIWGDITVYLDLVLILLVFPTLVLLKRRNRVDIQFSLLLISILLLLPVIIFENVLFMDMKFTSVHLDYSVVFMRFLFGLGILAYFFYNLHLMTIEDFPTGPIALTAIITGFSIGAMGVSAFVDPVKGIYYDPLIGGMLFIMGLMFFNLIGAFGFYLSFYRHDYSTTQRISVLDHLAIFLFFISPIFIYLTRILGWSLPVNTIFLVTELSFILHLLNFLLKEDVYGYPMHSDLLSLSIIQISTNVALAGYSYRDDIGFNKLQGMTIIAVDSVIQNVFETTNRDLLPTYTLDYGDTILLKEEDYLMVGLFLSGGKKTGKFVLKELLHQFVSNPQYKNKESFKALLKKYLYIFTRHKTTIKDEMIYY